jgi:hypothetical protein
MDVGNLLMKASDNLSVRRAFSTAYEKDDILIIPVAMVAGGGGGGTARPRQRDPAAGPDSLPEGGPAGPDAPPQDSGRTDAGGGFGGLVLPAGAYVVKGGQVRWVPAVDMTIVVLASLSLVRVLAHTWTRSRRAPPPAMTPFPAYPGDRRVIRREPVKRSCLRAPTRGPKPRRGAARAGRSAAVTRCQTPAHL